ncbi:MAG: hypothetical protein ACKOAX_07725, partial [Candidatus Kapaibacterium sp.]
MDEVESELVLQHQCFAIKIFVPWQPPEKPRKTSKNEGSALRRRLNCGHDVPCAHQNGGRCVMSVSGHGTGSPACRGVPSSQVVPSYQHIIMNVSIG